MIRQFFGYRLGNGDTASAWFDNWCDLGPLCHVIAREDITNAGYSPQAKVSDVFSVDFVWPSAWIEKYPSLATFCKPVLDDTRDRLVWKSYDGDRNASISCIWESIRPHAQVVSWFDVVWFNQCIPKHAFVMWLLMGEWLKRQDRLKPWELRNNPTLIFVNGSRVGMLLWVLLLGRVWFGLLPNFVSPLVFIIYGRKEMRGYKKGGSNEGGLAAILVESVCLWLFCGLMSLVI
ncbi:uncharacterized protein [Rutidosis leptorrhynchoides]|uniref:uncharacterized protein n=1 Tax=Rutidosis leptorrhynchoides TaxID=125765 RepID=UPI003A993A75